MTFRSFTGGRSANRRRRTKRCTGQQRLRAIFEFHAGEFGFPKDSNDIEGLVVAKMKYLDMAEGLRLRFDNYALDMIVPSDTSED
jgi:hypothetical protein